MPHVASQHLWNRRPHHVTHADHQGGLNGRIAVRVTTVVGTMWCAYAFVALAFYGLPAAVNGGPAGFVAWASSQFIQLVLLPIIIVGQNVQAKAADARSEQTFNDAEAILKSSVELLQHIERVHEHLAKQDMAISALSRATT